MKRILRTLAPIAVVIGIAACGPSDKDARQDLPVNAQHNDLSDASIVVMPDGFPNIAHKCLNTTGFWTTTDRTLIIIYNDRQCGGEGEMVVINGIPKTVINSGS